MGGDPADCRCHVRADGARPRHAHRAQPGRRGEDPRRRSHRHLRLWRGPGHRHGRHPLMALLAGHPAVAALRTRAFRRYLVGQLPSVTCSWAQVVALSLVVVGLAPHALGWVVALQFAPSLLLGPWFGAVADRHDRKRLLMLAEAGLGLVALSYALISAGP